MISHAFRLFGGWLAAPIALATSSAAWQGMDLVRDRVELSPPVVTGNKDLDPWDQFGAAVACLGDQNGDGLADLVVGAIKDDDGATNAGAIWTAFLNPDGSVRLNGKISGTTGGFGGLITGLDRFGSGVAPLGDLNGDGIGDIAVGAENDAQYVERTGAVWILFMKSDGTVDSELRIREGVSGFTGDLEPYDRFGSSLGFLGDLDGDGIGDIAVGASGDNGGAVWILFLNSNGSVKTHQKISSTSGGGSPLISGSFGESIDPIGDLDGDGVLDLAVGSPSYNSPAGYTGAVWILFMNSNGTVKNSQRIDSVVGGFGGTLDPNDCFGSGVARIGDLDGDSVTEIAVGAAEDDDQFEDSGAVWILFLSQNGTAKAHQKISNTFGGLGTTFTEGSNFGMSIAGLGDLDADGMMEVTVGSPRATHGGSAPDYGEVWILTLDSTGTSVAEKRIGRPDFNTFCTDRDFGGAVAEPGDLDGDGIVDLLLGSPRNNLYGVERGAVSSLLLNGDGTIRERHDIFQGTGGFGGTLANFDHFGASIARVSGYADLLVGAPGTDDGGADRGAVWVLQGSPPWTVQSERKINAASGGALANLDDGDRFGSSIACLGDLDGDGVDEIAVGAPGDDDGASDAGAVWVLFPDAAGVLHRIQKISVGTGGFGSGLDSADRFGAAVAGLGDLDGDGLADLAVGAPGDDTGGTDRGAVWILHLASSGAVHTTWKIGAGVGSFPGALEDFDGFGSSVASAGDFNGDGHADLFVGVPGDDTEGPERGAAWLVCLDPGKHVRGHRKIAAGTGGFPGGLFGPLQDGDALGTAVCSLADIDGNGSRELVAGAPGSDYFQIEDSGDAFLLFSNPVAAASLSVRNGSGVNPLILTSPGAPLLGSVWEAEVDAASIGAGGFVFLFLYSGSHPGLPMVIGEILLDPGSQHLLTDWTVAYGGISRHSIPVPDELAFSGLRASAQGYLSDVAPSGMVTNALDLTFGF